MATESDWTHPRWQLVGDRKNGLQGETSPYIALINGEGVNLTAVGHRWRVDTLSTMEKWRNDLEALALRVVPGNSNSFIIQRYSRFFAKRPSEVWRWLDRIGEASMPDLSPPGCPADIYRKWITEVMDAMERRLGEVFWLLAAREGHLSLVRCDLFSEERRTDLIVWADACMSGQSPPDPPEMTDPIIDETAIRKWVNRKANQ